MAMGEQWSNNVTVIERAHQHKAHERENDNQTVVMTHWIKSAISGQTQEHSLWHKARISLTHHHRALQKSRGMFAILSQLIS